MVDKLLTEYVDALNAGDDPDVNQFLNRCPERSRNELRELLETSLMLKENLIPEEYFRKSKAQAHELVHRLAMERKIK